MFDIKIKEITTSKHPNDGSFLQTPFWCEFKARHGWKYRRFLLETNTFLEDDQKKKDCDHNDHKCETGCCSSTPVMESVSPSKKGGLVTEEVAVLTRTFSKGLFTIAYVPLFPGLLYKCTDKNLLEAALNYEEDDNNNTKSENTAENKIICKETLIPEEIVTPETQTIEFASFLSDLAKALKPYLPKSTICIRFDPDVDFDTPEDRDMFNYGMHTVAYADRLKLKKNKVDIQPPDTTLVDLTANEDEILSRMHSKWRYNIRLSERKGVTIHKYNGKSINLSEKIDKFYELTKETNARDGNSSHAKSYYLDLIKSSADEIEAGKDVPEINLYIAEHEGDEIASIMTLFSKTEAIYLYGASSNNKRNLMPNHLLQWTAMKDAKAYGSKYYDMYGMPPEGKDDHHPMHGLYMFKANFGGHNIHRTGSWDVPLKFIYRLYNLAENFRAFWFKKVIKKFKGRLLFNLITIIQMQSVF